MKQPPALGLSHRGHLHRPIRTRRDRPGPLSGGLPDGSRGFGLETARPSVSAGPVEALDQGEEPPAPGDVAGNGGVQLTCSQYIRACRGHCVVVKLGWSPAIRWHKIPIIWPVITTLSPLVLLAFLCETASRGRRIIYYKFFSMTAQLRSPIDLEGLFQRCAGFPGVQWSNSAPQGRKPDV